MSPKRRCVLTKLARRHTPIRKRMPAVTSLVLFRADLELSTDRCCFDVKGILEARMETPAARTTQRVC